ncbi:uncharacterized protein LOC111941835 isoform X1 [Cyanistes caeruleus]|uniref:uncharacterized protein LOC111941835 isoform X1 n=1 Tax=Cyanistes caeruleus TaxID=156563 RepID=UPI000CDAD6B0|nr:uncharacterized protein LOC111941835 isoform X1 [Cyanistes caeruleus]
MAFPLRLFLLLLLAVALPDRAAQAAPWQAQRADGNHDMDYPEVLMNDGLKFLEDVGVIAGKTLGEGDAASRLTPRTEALGGGEVTGVSAGRSFPAPGLVAEPKPDSHLGGPSRQKIQNTADKKSLKRSELLRQMLKEMQQGAQEMKREPVQQETFSEEISDSVPDSAAGREAMPGTVTQDNVPGKASPLAWLHKVLKPSAPPTGVSAERTFPAPLLIGVQKPHFHRRGLPREKDKRTGEKESLQSKDIWKQRVEELQKGPDMDLEVLWKAAFPGGSGRSSAASDARRNVMPHTSTGLDTGDELARKAPPLAWQYEVLKPSGTPAVAGVSAEKTSPAPGLDAAHKPGSQGRGKTKHTSDKKSLEPFEVMWHMLKEMQQGAQEVDEEAVLKAALPGGSSGSLAASAAGREAMPGTVIGDWDSDMDYLEALVEDGLKFLEDVGGKPLGEGDAASRPTPRTEALGGGEVTGVSAGRSFPAPGLVAAPKPDSHRRVVDQKAKYKKALPRGSSGSLAASTAGKKAMPGTGPDTGDELAWKAPPLAWQYEVWKPSGTPAVAGVSAEKTSPAPGLDAAHKPGSHGRVPPTGKTKHTSDKKSLEPFEVMWQMLKEMQQGAQVVDQKAKYKKALPRGSSGSLAASTAGKKAMPGTGPDTGDASGTTRVPDSQKGIERGFCQGTRCWLGITVGLLAMELIFMGCFGICYVCKRKRSTSGKQLKDSGCTTHPGSLNSSSSVMRAWAALSRALRRGPWSSHCRDEGIFL